MMLRIKYFLRRLRREQRGASLVEYALLVALIAIVAITAVELTGTKVTSAFNTIAGKLPPAPTP